MTAPPDVVTAEHESRYIATWVQDALEDLRLNWGPEYGFGMLAAPAFGTFGAWRADGTGELMTTDHPGDLRALVRADAIADRDVQGKVAS